MAGSAIEWTDATLKKCTKCQKYKTRCQFRTDRSRKDGLSYVCNNCNYPHDPSKPTKKFRSEMFEKGKKYCHRCKKWLEIKLIRNGLCRKHRNEEWNERYKDPIAGARIRARVQARKRGILFIPLEVKEYLSNLFKHKCAYCRKNKIESWDHIVPVKKKGNSEPYNIAPACISCNSSKQDKNVFDWMLSKKFKMCSQLESLIILNGDNIYA